MLVVLAATGVLRGLQDTRTPLYVAVGGFAANAALNVGLVYGAGLGIAGSAWGTVIAQCGMAAAYLVVVVRGARRHGASLRPDAAGIRACAQAGVPLLVRTLSLRAVLMIATAVAARLGDAEIAAHQIVLSLWSLLAFALDAIAIAGQAIIGRYLGAGDAEGARAGLPPHGAVGHRLRRGARRAGRRWPARCSSRCSPATRRCRTPCCPPCWSSRSPSRSPAWSSCSTAC